MTSVRVTWPLNRVSILYGGLYFAPRCRIPTPWRHLTCYTIPLSFLHRVGKQVDTKVNLSPPLMSRLRARWVIHPLHLSSWSGAQTWVQSYLIIHYNKIHTISASRQLSLKEVYKLATRLHSLAVSCMYNDHPPINKKKKINEWINNNKKRLFRIYPLKIIMYFITARAILLLHILQGRTHDLYVKQPHF